MLKILQARLQQYVNQELPMFRLDLEKAEEPEIKLPTSAGSSKKLEEFQKNVYFCFIDYAKAFDCVNHKKLENSSRDGNTLPAFCKTCLQVSLQQLEPDTENGLVQNWERRMSRLHIVTLLI